MIGILFIFTYKQGVKTVGLVHVEQSSEEGCTDGRLHRCSRHRVVVCRGTYGQRLVGAAYRIIHRCTMNVGLLIDWDVLSPACEARSARVGALTPIRAAIDVRLSALARISTAVRLSLRTQLLSW